MAEERPTTESISEDLNALLEEYRLRFLQLGYIFVKLDDIAVCEYKEDTPISLLARLGTRANEHRQEALKNALRDLAVNLGPLVGIDRTTVFDPARGDIERTNLRVVVVNYDAFKSAAT